jgi:hypothetical protein
MSGNSRDLGSEPDLEPKRKLLTAREWVALLILLIGLAGAFLQAACDMD